MNAAVLPASLCRAALEMHALSEGDRSWVLAALPAQERSRLEPLLAELRALGIPPDASLLAAPVPRRDADVGLESLDAPRVALLARILAGEPAGVTRVLLAIRRWEWRAALLRESDPGLSVELAAMSAPSPAPRLQATLLRALVRRLEAPPPQPAPGAWTRLRALLPRPRRTP